jgi:hypothetical protein
LVTAAIDLSFAAFNRVATAKPAASSLGSTIFLPELSRAKFFPKSSVVLVRMLAILKDDMFVFITTKNSVLLAECVPKLLFCG